MEQQNNEMPRFIKIGAAGEQLPADAPEWVAVHHPASGKTFARTPISARRMSYAKCLAAAAKLDVLGHTDWHLTTIQELLCLVNYERLDPATYADFFPEIGSNWFWSSTPVAGGPEYAWHVYFYNGTSYWTRRDYEGFALACRGPVSPGQ